MKKSLLLFFSFALTSLFLQAQTVQRQVLVEQFTNASCPPCAAQNPAFNVLLGNNSDKAVVIKYQTDWPGYDPMNEQNPDEVQTRVDYYGVTGVPNVRIDGTTNAGTAGSVTQAMINTAYAIPATLQIDLTHDLAADLSTISITCNVTNPDMVNDFNVADARLRLGVIEKDLNFPTPPGSTDETHFNWVMRKMLPDALGTLVGTIAAGQTATFTWTVALPDYIYDYTQIGVVAFVQANGAKTVYQAAVSQPKPLPGAFPDAAFSGATVPNNGLCDYQITPSANVANEGGVEITSFDVSYSANGGAPVTINWTGSIMPGANETVDFAPLTIGSGETVLEYALSNINGGLQDINSLNDAVPAEGYYTLAADPIGHELVGDLESDEAEGIPSNSVVSRLAILDLMVVNQDWLTSQGVTANNAVGGFAQSANSVLCAFYISPAGTTSTMTFEKIDFTNNTSDSIAFDVAYRQYSSENDQLLIEVSTDCGVTWSTVYDKSGSELSTVGAGTAFFAPTSSQWRKDIVDLSSLDGESEVVVRFSATSQYGNNMYLDNINIGGVYVNAVEDAILEGNISVYPNPATTVVNVGFDMVKANKVSVQVYDVAGKLVTTLVDNELYNAGAHSIQWNNPASTGMYFVKIRTEEGEITKKVNVLK